MLDATVERHGEKCFIANRVAVTYARNAGIDPQKNAAGLAELVLRILDAVETSS